MSSVDEVEKAFHKARIENEQLLLEDKIRYCDYAEIMTSFEAQLREMGVDL